jgi:hypothetical protein
MINSLSDKLKITNINLSHLVTKKSHNFRVYLYTAKHKSAFNCIKTRLKLKLKYINVNIEEPKLASM